MREIEFRAWDDGELYEFVELTSYKDGSLGVEISKTCHDGLKRASDSVALEQYTGLKDKNGNKIFEGDIVDLAGYGSYEVEFPFIELYEAYSEGDIGEIIGNIHENPELVGK